MVIAIDGPAASGKSTVAKKLANKLSVNYLDTGALYRAITYIALMKNMDFENEVALAKIAERTKIDYQTSFKNNKIFIKISAGRKNLTKAIRLPEVSRRVSEVAKISKVRKALLPVQRSFARNGNLIAEGRDTGTVVFPDADLKIFLIANMRERAKRRVVDLKKEGHKVKNVKMIEREIAKRDQLDSSREISPLMKAPDAHIIDSSGKTPDEIVDEILSMLENKK